MEKNYYEILEVDKKASPEIIKKSYSTLAKKYHPDLQPEDMKQDAEEKFKLINEAYEVLSAPEKRKNYDASLSENIISKEEYDSLYIENQKLKNIINQMQKRYLQNNYELYDEKKETYDNMYDNQNSDYLNEDNNYDFNNNYDYPYQKTAKDRVKNLIAIIITILILFVLWHIPFVQNLIKDNILFNLFSIQ